MESQCKDLRAITQMKNYFETHVRSDHFFWCHDQQTSLLSSRAQSPLLMMSGENLRNQLLLKRKVVSNKKKV